MTDLDWPLAIICWSIALPLQLWGVLGGPAAASHVGMAAFVVGFVFFMSWAAAGGMPPMYSR